MARPETWRNLAPVVLARVKEVKNVDFFYRDDIEVLFEVEERTALRIIAKVGKDADSARPRVGRTKLIRYLQKVAAELAKGMARVTEIYSAAQHRVEETASFGKDSNESWGTRLWDFSGVDGGLRSRGASRIFRTGSNSSRVA